MRMFPSYRFNFCLLYDVSFSTCCFQNHYAVKDLNQTFSILCPYFGVEGFPKSFAFTHCYHSLLYQPHSVIAKNDETFKYLRMLSLMIIARQYLIWHPAVCITCTVLISSHPSQMEEGHWMQLPLNICLLQCTLVTLDLKLFNISEQKDFQ